MHNITWHCFEIILKKKNASKYMHILFLSLVASMQYYENWTSSEVFSTTAAGRTIEQQYEINLIIAET